MKKLLFLLPVLALIVLTHHSCQSVTASAEPASSKPAAGSVVESPAKPVPAPAAEFAASPTAPWLNPDPSAPAPTTDATDTLKAQVSEWNKLKVIPAKYGESRQVLEGTTHDLSMLDIRAYTLSAGQFLQTGSQSLHPGSPSPPEKAMPGDSAADQLLIVREGSLTITVNNSTKILGPGGIGLFSAGEEPAIANKTTASASYYVFRFRSRSPKDQQRATQAGPLLIDWPEMPMKKTDKGEGRQIFNRPVAWLAKIDMHATTLNAGEVSHPQHTHRNEEIILLRSGNVQMHIADGYHKASGGDLVFLASGVPHALENRSSERCEYFALQWQP